MNGGTQQTASQVFDIDKDGILDFALAERTSTPSVVWFKLVNGSWQKYVIDTSPLRIEAGGAHHDIDGDGDLDLVFAGDASSNEIWWWENPYPHLSPSTPWTRYRIKASGSAKHHDSLFGDFDGDGAVEFVTWNQGARRLLIAEIPVAPKVGPWSFTTVDTVSSGSYEGLTKIDIDLDGVVDIVGGGFWYKYLGSGNFARQTIDSAQGFTRAAAGQFIPGGRPEVAFVPGDADGPIYLYEWQGSSWSRKPLLGGVTIIHGHSLDIGDINRDGKLDIFLGEMGLTTSAPRMRLLYGDGAGGFEEHLLSTTHGNHESRLADLDGDGDLDILQKPYTFGAPGAGVWLNTSSSLPIDQWQRHVIDASRPWQSVFIGAADLDDDGHKDVITGGWWYRNPGAPNGGWVRRAFGSPLNNMAAIHDFDRDGDVDVLGTQGEGAEANDGFAWARNEGSGTFTVLTNIAPGDGNFLQGVASAVYGAGGLETALSWHADGKGIQMLTTPGNPSSEVWPWRKISSVSQNEALSSGDIDGDGDLDLLLGTRWLRNDNGSWAVFTLSNSAGDPDRNRLADMNGDGRLDAVVGYEAVSAPGKLAWYEQPAVATDVWSEHVIATVTGPMSLDVADADRDGDLDVLVGEHNLTNPASARLLIFANLDGHGSSWASHVIHTGDEHHDGAQFVDIDGDGDLDVVSIGWGHSNVLLYENRAVGSSGEPDIVPPSITSVGASAGSTFATISWTTDEPATSQVDYGPDTRHGTTTPQDLALLTSHRVTLSGLTPSATYYYRVRSSDAAGNEAVSSDFTFTTQEAVASGVQQTYLAFDGLNDRVQLPAFDLTGSATTIEFWFKADTLTNCSSRDCRFISKATGVNDGDHYWMVSSIGVGGAQRLRFRMKTNGRTHTLIAGSGNLLPGVWTHVAAVYDGSQMRLYKDGALVGAAAKSGPIDANSGADVWIGDNPPIAGSRPFAGAIEELRIWTVARSGPELQQAMHVGLSGTEPELFAYYPFNEGAGQGAYDGSGRGLHGVLGAGLAADVHDPAWVSPPAGDGTPPSVSINTPSDGATVSAAVTISASASDNVGIAGVQFTVNGVNLGSEDTEAPYAVSWDTASAANGPHTLAAVARDTSNNTTTSALVMVTVGNSSDTPAVQQSYLVFDGVNDRVQLPSFDLTGSAATIEFWFKADSLTNCASSDCRFISKATGLNDADHYWMVSSIGVGGVQRLRFRLKTNGATHTLIAGSGDLSPGVWTHASAVYDGAHMRLYKDGVLVGAAAKTGAIDANNAVGAWIGDNPPAAGSRPFDGAIEDMRIWTVARTSTELQQAMSVELAGSEPGLLAYYRFNEGSGQTAHDSSGHALHGRLGTSSVADANDPLWVNVTHTDPDTTSPSVSITSPLAGATVSGAVTVSAGASDNAGIAGVQFTVNGVNLGSEDTEAPFAVSWETASGSDGPNTLRARARDTSGNIVTSSSITVSVDNSPPVISGVLVSNITETEARISWTTNEGATSQVEFGVNQTYGMTTTYAPALLTSHAVTLSGLGPSTTYHYRVRSSDVAGNEAVSADLTFTTAGTVRPAYLDFDGMNDRVQLPAFDLTGSATTIEFWFKADSLTTCGSSDCRFISKAIGINEADHYWMVSSIAVGGVQRLRFRLKTNGATDTLIAGSGDLSPGVWTHVAAVYDGEQMLLYKDGSLVGASTKSGLIEANNAAQVWIGDNPPTTGSRPFDGSIEELRIWTTARSIAQLHQGMTAELAGTEPGLLAYYQFNEGTGQTVRDTSQHGLHGILGSSGGVDPHDPEWVQPNQSAVIATMIPGAPICLFVTAAMPHWSEAPPSTARRWARTRGAGWSRDGMK